MSKLEKIVDVGTNTKGNTSLLPLVAFFLEKQPLAKRDYTNMGNSYCNRNGTYIADD